MPTVPYVWYFPGCSERLTPPASATSHSRRRRLSTARCRAVSEEEQSVSTAMLGPWKSQTKETRLAICPWLRLSGTGCGASAATRV
ncbi:hypothetical protein SAZ11_02750 [Streptomyces sp. FXJ1.4098]|nr:hypothetical protein [Streptomyces sp. FXJ1.4098]